MSRSSSDRIKPQASSRCPSAGSPNPPSLASAAADDWPRTGNASTTRRSPSCASPPSASCCENYAIPHDVLGQTLRFDPLGLEITALASMVGALTPLKNSIVSSESQQSPSSSIQDV